MKSFLTLLILVLVRNFSYTRDTTFGEEFLLHNPGAGFNEEFLLDS